MRRVRVRPRHSRAFKLLLPAALALLALALVPSSFGIVNLDDGTTDQISDFDARGAAAPTADQPAAARSWLASHKQVFGLSSIRHLRVMTAEPMRGAPYFHAVTFRQAFGRALSFDGVVTVKPTVFGTLHHGALRAYDATVTRSLQGSQNSYRVIVDAATGKLLFRQNQVFNLAGNPTWKGF